MRQLCLLILFGTVAMGFCTTACDDGSSGSGDGDTDTDADGDTDTDADTDADTDTDTDSDTDSETDSGEDFVWILPEDVDFADAYGDATVQVVETDFDTSGVDLTLGGLNADIPAPTVNCMDDNVTQNCISVTGFDREGQFFEMLCIGEGARTGGSNVISPDDSSVVLMDRYDVVCDYRLLDPQDIVVAIEQWDSVPTIFDVSVPEGTETPALYVNARFSELANEPWNTTSWSTDAKTAGWAVHTLDNGDAEDWLFTGVFAVNWDDSAEIGLRIRGSFKGYM